jgi:hypothetical protein
LDCGHYNFSGLEKHHYYSRILKFAITIVDFPQICHGIRMKTTQVQLQVYTKTYISLYLRSPINDMWAPLVNIIFYLSSSLTQHHLPPSMASCSRDRAWPCARVEPRASSAAQAPPRATRVDLGTQRCAPRLAVAPLSSPDPLLPRLPSSSPPSLTSAPVLPRAPLRGGRPLSRAPPANLPTEEDEKKRVRPSPCLPPTCIVAPALPKLLPL